MLQHDYYYECQQVGCKYFSCKDCKQEKCGQQKSESRGGKGLGKGSRGGIEQTPSRQSQKDNEGIKQPSA